MKAKSRRPKRRKLPQRVHRSYLIREAQHFRDHKKGIPEWLKNSDDSYNRHEEFYSTDFSNLPIIINISKDAIHCLDFGGATAKDVIKHVPFYGSPDAAKLGREMKERDVAGGHGNGGKYYGLSQFKECKVISYYKGRLTVLTLDKRGDYVDIENKEVGPQQAIGLIGIHHWDYFDRYRKDLFNKITRKGQNLFCWKGINPRDKRALSKKSINKLITAIQRNLQSRSALRSRTVDVLWDGVLYWPDLKPDQILIDTSFGTREFILPKKLGGHMFNRRGNSKLRVSLSKYPLTGEKSSLNVLEIDANGKNIAWYSLTSLMMDKGLSKSLHAHIDCLELRDYGCVSNDRVNLIDNEISRIFLSWCRNKIQDVLNELVDKERKKEETKDLEELSSFLRDITKEISDLLEDENIIKQIYNRLGVKKSIVDIPTSEPGYGGEGEIKEPGGGRRTGKKERHEGKSSEKKAKSTIRILVSNLDDDPLNPGNKYNMIEREPILHQRIKDVDHGIWWINSQKNYIKKLKIKDPGSIPFYFFLIKEVVFSHRARRRYKEQSMFDPDRLEELNFSLIDEIFNRTVKRMGFDLAVSKGVTEMIRNAIKNKQSFTVPGLSKELNVSQIYIHTFMNINSEDIEQNFKMKKIKINGKRGPKSGHIVNFYIRK